MIQPSRRSDEKRFTLLILYSSGDLGDVGRHCIAIALKHPLVKRVRVLTNTNPASLYHDYDRCACPKQTHNLLPVKDRLQVYFPVDVCSDNLLPFLRGVDAVICCLGSRQPFHPTAKSSLVRRATENLVQAMLYREMHRRRLILLSSVGIGNDWPPLPGLRDGDVLAGLFRTICWDQYQDLSAAERAVHRTWSSKQVDYVTARCAILPDYKVPEGSVRIVLQPQDLTGSSQIAAQTGSLKGLQLDYNENIAKLDAARFLVQEAVLPTLHRQVVVIGGVNHPQPDENLQGQKAGHTAEEEDRRPPAQPRASHAS